MMIASRVAMYFVAFAFMISCTLGNGSDTTDAVDEVAVRLLQQQLDQLQVIVDELEASITSDLEICSCNETMKNLTDTIKLLREREANNSRNCSDDSSSPFAYYNQPVAKYEDCRQIYVDGNTESGMYKIWLVDRFESIPIWCDMDVGSERGWMTIQRRIDGQASFERPWKDYVSGFGSPVAEYWIGLKNIYTLALNVRSSRGGQARLRIDLEDTSGVKAYARYERFSVGTEADGYRLSVSGYSGTAGDLLAVSNNQTFHTNDQDNAKSCASFKRAGWWYKNCGVAALNGPYPTVGRPHNGAYKMQWKNWTTVNPANPDLRFVSMKLQRYM
ncbi:angiopoietin-2-like [Ciona intestinalis]